MLKNYLKTAWKNLVRNKLYSIINVSGLAVGLATAMMLLLWVLNEKSFDKFHKDYQNIYRIYVRFNNEGKEMNWGSVPGPLAVYSKSIPEIKSVVRINEWSGQVLSNETKTKNIGGNSIALVDSSFFSIFSFPLKSGNVNTLLPNINSIVLTEKTAQKFFGNEQAAGKTIVFDKQSFTVTGVLKDFPENSSLKYDAVLPMGYYAKKFAEWGGNGPWKTIDEDWGNFSYGTFIRVVPNSNLSGIAQKLTSNYGKNISIVAKDYDGSVKFLLQNIADMHLIGLDGSDSAIKMINIFTLVLILLLLIAAINYINLTTARSLTRVKEVSMRKIIGANRMQLFAQFAFETLFVFIPASILAMFIIHWCMPLYNQIAGVQLSFHLLNFKMWMMLLATVVLTYVASGFYPAMLLSSFKPLQTMKGKFNSFLSVTLLRKSLVVLQFSVSVILLTCTIVMSHQMSFLKNKDLGYDKNYVFSVALPGEVAQHTDAIKNELHNQAGITGVAFSNAYNVLSVGSSSGDISWTNKPVGNSMMISEICADKDFIPTMKMQLVEGNNFDGTPADSNHYILNETAVKKMGLAKPYIGQQIVSHGKTGTLIGIVKDFNFKSLKEKIDPLIIFTYRNKNILHVRTNAAGAQQAIAAVEKQYKKYADVASSPFSYTFLDQSFDEMYKSETRTGLLFKIFAGIAIFISCLGLFGLATYTAQVKTKEIGIRKVLGASVPSIVKLISIDFLKLVVISILIAVPVAWIAMSQWLQEFEYRASLSWWIFFVSGMTSLLIAFITISFQSIKAAMANPVKSLKTE